MTKTNGKHSKPVIGLLGGVGAGKSSVAAEFVKLGCESIDADRINHQILTWPEIVEVLVSWWGGGIVSDGQLDRGAIAQIVFGDQAKLKKLTNYLYPLIFKEVRNQIALISAEVDVKAIILDAPVLLEAEQGHLCDFLVFVEVEESIRHERLIKNRNWDKKRIKNVENCQIPLDMKAKMSDYIVNNSSGITDTAQQVASVFSRIISSTASE
ncbi:MAG: dephospho-CoA kinase [Phycisphaerae bacterium]|nr:dephospho-CoA kinase [Phycisphaerae bacterium]